jgi:hypothetical protein
MIVKDSQLQKQEWPMELTPELREQFLQEKIARVNAWYQLLEKHEQYTPNLDRS